MRNELLHVHNIVFFFNQIALDKSHKNAKMKEQTNYYGKLGLL